MKTTFEQHYELTQQDIIAAIVKYVSEHADVAVEAKDVKLDIKDSSRGGYMDDGYTAASVTARVTITK